MEGEGIRQIVLISLHFKTYTMYSMHLNVSFKVTELRKDTLCELINKVSVQNAFHTGLTTYLVRMWMNGYRSEFQDSPVVMCGSTRVFTCVC